MKTVVDFEVLRKFIDVPKAAEIILSKPEKEIHFSLNLKTAAETIIEGDCYVVYHNTVRGPAKGGCRISPGVTLRETQRLAELMTLKTSLAGIPFGGGKSSIALDPSKLTRFEKTAVLKEYVHMLRQELDHGEYIPAPDIGSGPTDMAVIFGETHLPESVTGKPVRIGGLPGRLEATGRGVSQAALLALERFSPRSPGECTAAVQGYGNVGSHTALFLRAGDIKVVAASDCTGGVYNEGGLDTRALAQHVAQQGAVTDFPGGEAITNADLLALKVDVLLPCAKEDVLTADNAADVNASIVVEGANGPVTPEADRILAERGIPVIPDILANSGGVIASYVEWRKAKSGALTTVDETFDLVDNRIRNAFAQMLECSAEHGCSLRQGCFVRAVDELVQSMRDRDWI